MLVKRNGIFVNFFGLMRYFIAIILLLLSVVLHAQNPLTIEGQSYVNSDETWIGVNIPRSSPTLLTFRNNSITSSNINGYMLEAGDEVAGAGSAGGDHDADLAAGAGVGVGHVAAPLLVARHDEPDGRVVKPVK